MAFYGYGFGVGGEQGEGGVFEEKTTTFTHLIRLPPFLQES
jgi:hypothetical protein